MKKIKRGDIFYANLDKTVGSEQSGIRPVVVIQNNRNNRTSPTVIIAPISTKKNRKLPYHILVKQFDKIRHNSIILLEQIRTLDKSRLMGYVCSLNKDQLVEINIAIKNILDID